MTISVENNKEITLLKMEGRLDTLTASYLQKAIEELPNSVTMLVLDMKGVDYVSSAGLRVLLNAQKKMNKVGSMKLRGVCKEVMEVFEITGFLDILSIEN